jgi:4,5-dihydroxyphthalate decarboxylase
MGGEERPASTISDLFPNAAALEAAWYKRTGIYPFHGTIVVKDSVLKQHPWVARSLHQAFAAAKAEWLHALCAGEAGTPSDEKYRRLIPLVGPDPLPFGLAANLPTVQALESYAYKQQLIPRRMSIGELLADSENV